MLIKVKRILILRPDNLGDIILFSGALREIRNHYRNAKIIIVIRNNFTEYVKGCPHVDEVLSWENLLYDINYSAIDNNLVKRISSKKIVKYISKIAWRMRRNTKYKSDLLLLPVRSVTGGVNGIHWVAGQLKSKDKIGISGDFSNQTTLDDKRSVGIYSKRMKIEKEDYWQHEFITYISFLKFIGVTKNIANLWPELWVKNPDKLDVKELLQCNKGRVRIAICPGAAVAVRNYPVEKYKEIFESVNTKERISLILLGGIREVAICDELESSLKDASNIKDIHNLSGKTSISQMMKVVNMCDLLLSVETSVAHVGITLRKPTVVIVGGGHYGRFYPWGDSDISKAAENKMDCFHCNWHCIYPEVRCIKDLTAKLIAHNINYLLNKKENK